MTDTNTAEREAFEKWVVTEFPSIDLTREDDGYYKSLADEWWTAFKAGRASLAASAGSEPLTDSYVQMVPDKCDRIVWRNHYYHLPLNSATHPSPPEGMVAVPKEFIRAFSDTAHNYQLSVEPPDHFSGTEGDAFRAAYARCGVELLRLRGILIGTIPASEAKEL